MGENQFKTFGFLLKFVLLLQLMYVIHNHQFGVEATQVYDRLISKIEAQNHLHEKEILLLKTEKTEDRKEIHQLRERVALLEDSAFSNVTPGDKISRTRSERPARLLPLQLLFNTKKNESEEDVTPKRFYGPPTNCSELQKLGYTLNGYYLIKGNKDKLNANRIQAVYCQFYQPFGGNKQNFQTWIGNVEVKTKSIHFYVTRNTRLSSGHGDITFDYELLNVGGAMNLKTGQFTAPVDGIYHFEFRCLKDEVPQESTIYLVIKEKNRTIPQSMGIERNVPIVSATSMSNLSYYSTGSLTTSLKLRKSDVVKLYSRNGRENLYESEAHYTQFVGWLVEEDLAAA